MTGAIVQALLESAWQGLAITALLFVMLRVLPRDRPRVRYAAALGALVAMLGGFLMAFVDGAVAPVAGVGVIAARTNWPAWLWMAGVRRWSYGRSWRTGCGHGWVYREAFACYARTGCNHRRCMERVSR